MEEKLNPKVIFGLSPRATLINAAILLFVSQLFWCLYFVKQIPASFIFSDYSKEYAAPYIDSVPWYVDSPLQIISMILVMYWIDYTYKIEKSDYSWRGIKYKFLYPIFGFTIAGSIIKIVILLILL